MADAPAFQFYPSDWVMGTLTFSVAEDGAYLRCILHQWNTGAVPGDDLAALARVMRVTQAEARKLWAVVREKFHRGDDGLWRNSRLEAERQKQADYRQAKIDAGRRGGLAKGKQTPSTATVLLEANGVANGVAKPSSSSSSSSSSSKPPSTKNVEGTHTRLAPIRHPSPLAWDRQHGRHVVGFCSWVCLPQAIFDEFVNRVVGAGASEPDAVQQVREWAEGVKAAWVGRIPGDDIFAFWRNEWATTHGSNKPAASAGVDPLGGVREALRHV